jgi:tetratricopeptide (TPR) repeat protein
VGKSLCPAEQIEKSLDSISFLELASEYFVEGNSALRRGDSLMALRFFETAFMLDENSNFLRNTVIELAITVGIPESAVMVIQRGRPLSEIDDDELRQLVAIFLRFRAYGDAFETISAIREKNRSDTIIITRMVMAESLIVIGSLFNARGEHDSAAIAFNKVLDLGIKTTEILFGLGVASERKGEIERAERYFKEVLAMNTRHALAANYLAYMWAERNINLEKAKALVLIALEEEPDNGAYLDTYGWILFLFEQYEEALPLLLRAAELVPEEYVVFYHVARTYLALNNKENALKFFKKANTFEGNPDFDRIAEFILKLSE